MGKKDSFKEFVKDKPELVDYIRNKEMTWQDFYEIYDIYGEDNSAWDKYKRASTPASGGVEGVSKFGDIMKSIDVDSIQKHIEQAQKALGFVQDLTTKGTTTASGLASSAPKAPRPINKFFED